MIGIPANWRVIKKDWTGSEQGRTGKYTDENTVYIANGDTILFNHKLFEKIDEPKLVKFAQVNVKYMVIIPTSENDSNTYSVSGYSASKNPSRSLNVRTYGKVFIDKYSLGSEGQSFAYPATVVDGALFFDISRGKILS